jgi:hypothetical protein
MRSYLLLKKMVHVVSTRLYRVNLIENSHISSRIYQFKYSVASNRAQFTLLLRPLPLQEHIRMNADKDSRPDWSSVTLYHCADGLQAIPLAAHGQMHLMFVLLCEVNKIVSGCWYRVFPRDESYTSQRHAFCLFS